MGNCWKAPKAWAILFRIAASSTVPGWAILHGSRGEYFMVSTPSLFLGVLRSETCGKPSFLGYRYCVIVPIGRVHSSHLLLLDEGLNLCPVLAGCVSIECGLREQIPKDRNTPALSQRRGRGAPPSLFSNFVGSCLSSVTGICLEQTLQMTSGL